MTNVSARWVSRLLTEQDKSVRVQTFSRTLRTGRREFFAEHHYVLWVMAPFLWSGDKSRVNGMDAYIITSTKEG